MWPDFPHPRWDIEVCVSHFGDASERWKEAVSNCNFIHAVQLVLPGMTKVPEDVNSWMASQEYHVVQSMPVKDLVSWDFVQTFARQGKLHLLSVNTSMSEGNCVAVTPAGQLWLSLQEDVFHGTGLEYSHLSSSSKEHRVYGSMIDLRKECFRPEKKNYERVRQSLERCGELVANVAVCWEPPEEPPSLPALSAKSHFSHAGYNVVTCKPRHRSSVEFTQSTPAALETLDLEEEDLLPVHEWLGAVVCGIASRDPENLDDEFVSRYHCPQPSTEVSRLLVADWRGFFTPACVVHLVSLLRQCMVGEEWPFFCLVLHRFDDDPTQPCDKHRSLLLGRSSELSIVCAANGRYCLFRSPK
ncbi:ribonuclease P protein subunit p40-like isoform X2 [Haemaphysalis longicornis]